MENRKYILIYWYHDTYVTIYDSIKEVTEHLENLKEFYRNDNDFRYKVFYGIEVNNL